MSRNRGSEGTKTARVTPSDRLFAPHHLLLERCGWIETAGRVATANKLAAKASPGQRSCRRVEYEAEQHCREVGVIVPGTYGGQTRWALSPCGEQCYRSGNLNAQARSTYRWRESRPRQNDCSLATDYSLASHFSPFTELFHLWRHDHGVHAYGASCYEISSSRNTPALAWGLREQWLP